MRFCRKILTYARRFTLILVFLLEIALLYAVLITRNQNLEIFNFICKIFGFFISIYIISGKKQSAYKLLWVFFILIFPILGTVSYLFMITELPAKRLKKKYEIAAKNGIRERGKSASSIDKLEEKLPMAASCGKYLESVSAYTVYADNQTAFYTPGESFFDELLYELSLAKKYIFLEYFILSEGKMFSKLFEILKQKAKDGVTVRIIYDDIGSFLTVQTNLPKHLSHYGIECVKFNKFVPFITSLHNNRDHRKIACIDGVVAFTGGVNIADEYINEHERFGHWLDCAVKIKGSAAWSLAVIFLENWCLATNSLEDFSRFLPTVIFEENTSGFVQPYADSPLDDESVGENVYLKIINSAKNYLYICTPYLIPSENILSALKLAAKSGVKIKIITPRKWDKWYVHLVTRSYYRERIDSGIEIYEYSYGFIHSKIFVSDGNIATVGTANLDYRSLFLNFECGTVLYGTETVIEIENSINKIVEHSNKIDKSSIHSSVIARMLRALLRIFAPLL